MLEVIKIYTILAFFIYIILCSIVYIVGRAILEKRNEKNIEKLKLTFGAKVQKHIETLKLNEKLSKIDIDYIKSKILKKNYFEVFNNIIRDLNTEKENEESIKKYILYFETEILKIVRKYEKADDTKKTFIVSLLGEYKLNNYELNIFLFNCLNTKSIYLRVETLRTLSKIGNASNILKALEFISKEEKYVNSNILIDILDNFNGDFETLDKKLLLKFDTFNYNIQKDIIGHLSNTNAKFVKYKIGGSLDLEKIKKLEVNSAC